MQFFSDVAWHDDHDDHDDQDDHVAHVDSWAPRSMRMWSKSSRKSDKVG